MKEKTKVIIITIVLLLLGVLAVYFSMFATTFTFTRTELTFSENKVQEILFYTPNQNYHTLFRSFQTQLSDNVAKGDYIKIENVTCHEGTEYHNTFSACETKTCFPYTESNEYGCSFGHELGFQKAQNYQIAAEYTLNPQNLIKIKNNYYIKFIAYSPQKHPLLTKNKNFFVSYGAITRNTFLPQQFVTIYIPFNGDTSKYKIIEQNSFVYNNSWIFLLWIIVAIFPALFFVLMWIFYGREYSHLDVPETLSNYPKERKGWEVAAIFQAPFGKFNSSATLLDFQRRKIISLKAKDKKTYIKILKESDRSLDEVEKAFLDLLIEQYKKAKKAGDFAELSEMGKDPFKWIDETQKLKELIGSKTDEYIENRKKIAIPLIIVIGVLFLTTSFLAVAQSIFMIVFLLISFMIILITAISSAVLIRFKGEYYKEYQQWQAFKNYLKEFPSMKEAPHEAVILWDKYLVYATALGVSKVVLQQLREWKIIDEKTYNTYYPMIIAPTYSGGSYGSAGGSGFGAGGGGGVGGGGGGGR
jgi:uncharacterized membrane protein